MKLSAESIEALRAQFFDGVKKMYRESFAKFQPRSPSKRRGTRLDADYRPQTVKRLPDDVLTKVTLFYYSDPRDVLIKGLAE